MSKLIDLTNKKYGKLTVIHRAADIVTKSGKKRVAWFCSCDCGGHGIFAGDDLKRGDVASCRQCRTRSGKNNSNYRHGAQGSRLYKIWSNMKSRCYTESATEYSTYGGRGITVCDCWQNSFIAFYDWAMSNGYSDDLTLDRIDVNGNYEPSNCRFADHKIQGNNTTRNHYIEYDGKMHTMSEWSDITGLNYYTLRSRINILGWDTERALTTPQRKHK